MTRILFARHGQTDYNIDERVCGKSPAELTEEGKNQARKLGKLLENEGVDVILCSPLKRARDTALIANEYIGAKIITDDRFAEWDYGSYEAILLSQAKGFQEAKLEFGVRLGGGESVLQLAHRVYSAIDDIRKNYDQKTALVVCHGGVCRVAYTYFNDMTMDEFANYYPDNGKVYEYFI